MTMSILGVRLDAVTEAEAVERISEAAGQKRKYTVATVNPEFIMAAQTNPQFKQVLNKSNLALADGVGILWAANLTAYKSTIKSKHTQVLTTWLIGIWYGIKTFLSLKFRTANLPQQVSGSNLVIALAKAAAKQNLSLFLLGGSEGIAAKAAAILKQTYPQLQISGTLAGDGSAAGDQESRSIISQHPSDIILVAYGAPKQELWIDRNLPHIPVSVAIGVGGTFRFISGDIRRAPAWIQRTGFEWLFRLIQEPWRWRRQIALPIFVKRVIADGLTK